MTIRPRPGRFRFTPKTTRTLTRTAHLALGFLAAHAIYGPVSAAAGRAVLANIVFPGFLLTGGYLWQQARLRRLTRRLLGRFRRTAPDYAARGSAARSPLTPSHAPD